MHGDVNPRFEQRVGATIDPAEEVGLLDVSHEVLNPQTPIVEDCVHCDIALREHATVRLLDFHHDMWRLFECTITNSPFPPFEIRWVQLDHLGVVHCPNVRARVVDDDAHERDAKHELETAVVVFGTAEKRFLDVAVVVCSQIADVDISTVENAGERVFEEM